MNSYDKMAFITGMILFCLSNIAIGYYLGLYFPYKGI